jgi:hypothetical protein
MISILSSLLRVGALSTALVPNQQPHTEHHIPIQPLEKNNITFHADMYNPQLVKEFCYNAQIKIHENPTIAEVILNSYETKRPLSFETDIEPKIKRNLAVYLAENLRGAKKFSFTKLNEHGNRITTICTIQDCLEINSNYKGVFTEQRNQSRQA